MRRSEHHKGGDFLGRMGLMIFVFCSTISASEDELEASEIIS